MLSDAELASMRGEAEAQTFDATAVIQTQTVVSDGGGGGTVSWAAAGTVSCHLAPIILRGGGTREQVSGGRIDAEADWTVILPAETAVSTDARIVVDSRTFEVLALETPRSFELTRRAQVKEVL